MHCVFVGGALRKSPAVLVSVPMVLVTESDCPAVYSRADAVMIKYIQYVPIFEVIIMRQGRGSEPTEAVFCLWGKNVNS